MPDLLRFHKSLYAKAGIDAAVEAYSSLAKITLSEDGEEYTAEVCAHNEEHQEAVVDHFSNHALFTSLACQMDGP